MVLIVSPKIQSRDVLFLRRGNKIGMSATQLSDAALCGVANTQVCFYASFHVGDQQDSN